jgi:hypothetical protein
MRYSVRKGFAFPVVVKRSEALPLYMKAKPQQMISGFGKGQAFPNRALRAACLQLKASASFTNFACSA